MPKSYAILDIETVPDHKLWSPEIEPEEIRMKDGKAPTKGEIQFLIHAYDIVAAGTPIHAKDIEKANDVCTRIQANGTMALETLPAPAIIQTFQNLARKLPEEKKPMAPVYAQRPIVIGILFLDEALRIKKLGAITAADVMLEDGDFNERKILERFSEFMSTKKPIIVDWNGRGFDLPVLALRSFRHGVPVSWYYDTDRNYRYRYSGDPHLDLFDNFSDFGAVNKTGMKLDNFAKAIGLPGKFGVDGSMVEDMFRAGKIKEIETYCMCDVIQTAFVDFRFLFIKGEIGLEVYQRAAADLIEAIERERRFDQFMSLVDRSTLLLADISTSAPPQTPITQDTHLTG
jgi:3'-5' exonuclease